MRFGALDADKTLTIALEHAQILDDKQYAYIQSALRTATSDARTRCRIKGGDAGWERVPVLPIWTQRWHSSCGKASGFLSDQTEYISSG